MPEDDNLTLAVAQRRWKEEQERADRLERLLEDTVQKQAERLNQAVKEFAEEVWDEMLKNYRTLKVMPLTMAKEWINRRNTRDE